MNEVWLFIITYSWPVCAVLAVFFVICLVAYEMGHSQAINELVKDAPMRIFIQLKGGRKVVQPVWTQDEAQRILNEYIFYIIAYANVVDNENNLIIARMDEHGRLQGS